MNEGELLIIRNLILEMLARREHSAWELERKLVARGYQPYSIKAVLTDLCRDNIQSDQRFTEIYICSRVDRGFGPYRIMAELKERGISKDLITYYLEREEQWGRQVVEARNKRFGQKIPSNLKERNQQIRFLQYRGFTQDQINYALNEIDR
ncbi:RecX family transcriptional regulator [Candidatus Nitrosoglobus terrae]|uniref:Regulatory protein RecX n=1 Tax=Candidatus Nitrosoglobus terrae TaxID=1630141 RepID=A0A1Q2SNQ9_9GAMM|nr:regulatory protein RecX [Candidatus Nitrosoglobus terrae]BAW80762.1 RecX family transcriptional regulator [Candidatus Nitrosoglobus terrae]